MRSVRKHLPLMAVVILLSPLLSGCFLRTLAGGFGTSSEGGRLIVSFEAGFVNATCVRETVNETSTAYECIYLLRDEFSFEFTSTVELISEFGFLGVLIDPLILQVPADANNVAGTFQATDGSVDGDLVISVVDQFGVQPGTVISAEPGQKFVILEFPPNVASTLPSGDPRSGVDFDFDLSFDLPSPGPVEVKGMSAGRVDVNGQTFYIPLLPCVEDFADVPPIQVPASETPLNLLPQVQAMALNGDLVGCDGKVYDFRTATDPGPGPEPGPRQVDIDIKPGSDPNAINPANMGVIPVAILTTADFDATTVDSTTVAFGPNGASPTDGTGHVEDVDNDGDLDLVLHFRTEETGIECGDTEAVLSGETFDGQFIEGADSVKTVGCRHHLKGGLQWTRDQAEQLTAWLSHD